MTTLGMIGLIVHEALVGRALQTRTTDRHGNGRAEIPARERARLAVR